MPLLRDEVKSPLNVPLFLYDFQKQASSCPLQEEFVAAFSLNGCVLVFFFFDVLFNTTLSLLGKLFQHQDHSTHADLHTHLSDTEYPPRGAFLSKIICLLVSKGFTP